MERLLADPRAAILQKAHRTTIRSMEDWPRILAEVQKRAGDIAKRDAERIAEVLGAVKLWRHNVIAVGDTRLGFDALDLHRWLKRDKAIHAQFGRRSAKFLKALRAYRAGVEAYEEYSEGYRACLAACDQLDAAIERRISKAPSNRGTLLQSPSTPAPHTFAARIIVPILRRKGYKRESALRMCAKLLTIVWPELASRLSDIKAADRFADTLWKACQRRGQPPC